MAQKSIECQHLICLSLNRLGSNFSSQKLL